MRTCQRASAARIPTSPPGCYRTNTIVASLPLCVFAFKQIRSPRRRAAPPNPPSTGRDSLRRLVAARGNYSQIAASLPLCAFAFKQTRLPRRRPRSQDRPTPAPAGFAPYAASLKAPATLPKAAVAAYPSRCRPASPRLPAASAAGQAASRPRILASPHPRILPSSPHRHQYTPA